MEMEYRITVCNMMNEWDEMNGVESSSVDKNRKQQRRQ